MLPKSYLVPHLVGSLVPGQNSYQRSAVLMVLSASLAGVDNFGGSFLIAWQISCMAGGKRNRAPTGAAIGCIIRVQRTTIVTEHNARAKSPRIEAI